MLAGLLAIGMVSVPSASFAGVTYAQTVGGVAHTWTNPANAGGTEGPLIQSGWTVQIACVTQGFRVQDGNTNWYRIDQSPWSNQYYVSADAFYNNGATSGSLSGTPYVDPAVPDCNSLPTGVNETTGGNANTWTNPANAGGSAGPQIPSNATVQIACVTSGLAVQDGNTNWYLIASAPWSNQYYVSADAFYNNGATSGSLVNTPYVDSAVPACSGSGIGAGGTKPAPAVTLTQGPAASNGYWYAISLNNFPANSTVIVTCYDSASPGGFQPLPLTTSGAGTASEQNYCFSGDGPDHWVVAGGAQSNHVSWTWAGQVVAPSPGSGQPPNPKPSPGPAPTPVGTFGATRCAADLTGQIVDQLSVAPAAVGFKVTVRPGPKGKVSWYADNDKIAAATKDMWNIIVPCFGYHGFKMNSAQTRTVYYQLNCHFWGQRFQWLGFSFGGTYDLETWRTKTAIPSSNLLLQNLYRTSRCNWT